MPQRVTADRTITAQDDDAVSPAREDAGAAEVRGGGDLLAALRPLAPVRVRLRGESRLLEVEVVNDPAAAESALTGAGTGNGLRVSACGARLEAGPTADGGRRIATRLPLA